MADQDPASPDLDGQALAGRDVCGRGGDLIAKSAFSALQLV
jgi:hypothetical protein